MYYVRDATTWMKFAHHRSTDRKTWATLHGCKLQSRIGKFTCWNGAHTCQPSSFHFECTSNKSYRLQGSRMGSWSLCWGCCAGKLYKCNLQREGKHSKWEGWHGRNGCIIWHGMVKKKKGAQLFNWAWCRHGCHNREGNGLCYPLQKLQILCTGQGKGKTRLQKNLWRIFKVHGFSVACELWNKAPLSNTTLCQMQEKVPYGVEKWSDITHAKRSLTTRSYNISQHWMFSTYTDGNKVYLAISASATVLHRTKEIH